MPHKGFKRPRCVCGHADISHWFEVEGESVVLRGKGPCRVKNCDCRRFFSEDRKIDRELLRKKLKEGDFSDEEIDDIFSRLGNLLTGDEK